MTPFPAIDPPEVLGAFLRGEPVARLTGHEFEGLARKEIVSAAYDGWKRTGYRVFNAAAGFVELSKSGIHDSMAHGIGRRKIAAFAAVPEIVAGGRLVRLRRNWEGRGYDSYILAAPLEVAKEPCIALLVANKNASGCRFYLHEVASLDETVKMAEVFRTGSSEETSALSRNLGDIRSIALSIFAVNGGVAESARGGGE